MCGHDLRVQPLRKQRVSWVDAILVLAVVAVLIFWWQIGSQPQLGNEDSAEAAALLPTNIPRMTPSPSPAPTEEATPVPTPVVVEKVEVTHEVRQGETLLGIAGIYGVTVDELQAANGLSDVLIRVGDLLVVPVEETQATAPLAASGPGFQYTVLPGDTVISIAVNFGSTVRLIQDANGLTANSLIRPGDELIIPVPQVPSEVAGSASGGEGSSGSDSSSTIYIEPQLIGPPDGATIAQNEAVLLRWISVDLLEENEWYVVLVYPRSGLAQVLPSIWTKATSYRLPQELAPAEGESASYAWQVSVVRVKPGSGGRQALEAASPSSEIRDFTWE